MPRILNISAEEELHNRAVVVECHRGQVKQSSIFIEYTDEGDVLVTIEGNARCAQPRVQRV